MAQVVPTESPNEKQHRAVIATQLNELIRLLNTFESDSWTPVISGASTAGTYELAGNQCRYTRMGRRVFLDVDITLAAVITGGGTGTMQITGMPYGKANSTLPQGTALLIGVNRTDASTITLSWNLSTNATALVIQETNDNAALSQLAVTGLAVNDRIIGSICYETDDI